MSTQYTFTAEVWLWKGDSAWHFISLPHDVADDIDDLTIGKTRGFGSVPVDVQSKDVTWRTSIFPDKKRGTFILPLKKHVRQQLGCEEGSMVDVTLRVLLD